MLKYFILIFLGLSLQLTLANIDETIQNLNIPGISELSGNITSKIPTEGDIEEAFAKKCEKLGGPEAAKKITTAKNEAVECIKGLVDFNELQEEMEKAKPTGDLDSVFKKYCKKTPKFKECVSSFTESFRPCLEEEEKSSMTVVMNVTEQLAEFICYKEGDRIALFIAEGGPECLESSKDAIMECVDTIFKKHFPNAEEITLNDFPLLLFKAQQCEEFNKIRTCVVKKLEKCHEPTPANIVDSLFTFVKKATPCSTYKFTEETADAAPRSTSSISYTSSSSLAMLCSVVMLRFLVGNQQ